MTDAALGRALRRVAWIVGAGLYLAQYLSPRSFWVDELALLRNLVDRDLAELVSSPLDFDQVAPVGFLAIEKAVVVGVGASEYALRLVPLAMALLALALVGGLGRVVIGGWASVVPMLLLACSGPVIWMSSQLKQYSTDMAAAAALLLVAVTVPTWRANGRGRRLVLLMGAGLPWISQPAVFPLGAAVLALGLDDWRGAQRISPFARRVALAWGLSGLAAILSAQARITPETLDFMQRYWQAGFAPFPPESWREWKWPVYTMRMLVGEILNGAWTYGYLALAVLGTWVLWRRSRRTIVIVLVPLAAALAASVTRSYPLTGRVGFHLLPLLVILIGAGVDGVVRGRFGPRWSRVALGALLVAAPVGMLVRRPPPYRAQHVRPLLETLRAGLRVGDRVYVPYGGWQAWTHYAPTLGIYADVVIGTCHGRALPNYEREVERLRGARRAWVLFIPAGELRRPDDIGHLVGRLGTRRDRWVQAARNAKGAGAEIALDLYDMAEDDRGQVSTATVAPVGPAVECRGAAVDRRLSRSGS